jgi:hypothetical protein
VGSKEPTGTLDGSWGTAMTWKDELLMLWIFSTVVMAFAARHFFGGAVGILEQIAASSLAYVPGLLHVLTRHFR